MLQAFIDFFARWGLNTAIAMLTLREWAGVTLQVIVASCIFVLFQGTKLDFGLIAFYYLIFFMWNGLVTSVAQITSRNENEG